MTAETVIRDLLADYGLQSLTQWALRQIQQGRTETEIVQSLRETSEFATRFPAIKERERKGLPPLSPAQYVEYERSARNLMRFHNLPANLFDRPDDLTELLANDVSLDELNARINDGYAMVKSLPPEVKQWFGEKYGPQSDQLLAAFYLDPDKSTPMLLEASKAAAFGGTAKRFGFEVGRDTAERAIQVGVTAQEAQAGFEQLSVTDNLYREAIGENDDLSAEVQGVRATFGLDATAQTQVRNRQRRRQASFSGGGEYSGSQSGLSGIGEAAPV